VAADPNAAFYEQQAAQGTGIPVEVVKQQAIAESGEGANPGPSSAGAMGFWQFEPATYNQYAGQAGVPQNSMSNTADETKVYITYMNALLKQEGGSIFKSLEAYNAGPGNLNAGAGYASGIEAKAGVSQNATAGTGTNLTDFHIPGTNINIPTSVGGILGDLTGGLLSSLGIPDIKDLLQRLALIIFGAVLIIVGIRMLSSGSSGGKQAINIQTSSKEDESTGATTKTRTIKTPVSKHTKVLSSKGGSVASESGGVGAGEAVEAAAVA
jgi:hypothetical protein